MRALWQSSFVGMSVQARQTAPLAALSPRCVVCSLRPHKKLIVSPRCVAVALPHRLCCLAAHGSKQGSVLVLPTCAARPHSTTVCMLDHHGMCLVSYPLFLAGIPPVCVDNLCRLPQPQLASRRQPSSSGRSVRTADAAATGSVGSGWMDMPESQPLPDAPLEVFPRRRESDPYK